MRRCSRPARSNLALRITRCYSGLRYAPRRARSRQMEHIARYDQADTGLLEIRTAAGGITFGPLVQVFGPDRAEAALARWRYELTSGWREQADGTLAADV